MERKQRVKETEKTQEKEEGLQGEREEGLGSSFRRDRLRHRSKDEEESIKTCKEGAEEERKRIELHGFGEVHGGASSRGAPVLLPSPQPADEPRERQGALRPWLSSQAGVNAACRW